MIVIISIISIIAVPKFTQNLQYANITKIRSDLLMIRSNIQQYKNEQLLKATTSSYPNNLDSILTTLNIESSWIKQSDTIYMAKVGSSNNIEFLYDQTNGQLDCLHKVQEYCEDITR